MGESLTSRVWVRPILVKVQGVAGGSPNLEATGVQATSQIWCGEVATSKEGAVVDSTRGRGWNVHWGEKGGGGGGGREVGKPGEKGGRRTIWWEPWP